MALKNFRLLDLLALGLMGALGLAGLALGLGALAPKLKLVSKRGMAPSSPRGSGPHSHCTTKDRQFAPCWSPCLAQRVSGQVVQFTRRESALPSQWQGW